MTTIDHRILIPAPPDVVWDYVSDITHNPDWQVDCTDVIFLTSRREGPGLRWRYATPGGHELVIAVTAWYNGLGYEYYFVDGTPFRENKGRIRLQEIPEGTIVQWTFTYELGGVLSGMRNSLGMKRQVDQTISESLKTLWQKIKQSSGGARTLEPKSLMKDAPDVEARSSYQPRHPSVVDMGEAEKPIRVAPVIPMKVEPPIWDDDAQPIRIYDEPPVKEDDTRPRSPFAPPAASKAAPTPEIDADFEPDFLDDLVEDEVSPFDEQFETVPDSLDDMDDDEDWRFEPPRDASDTQPRTIEEVIALGTAAELTEQLVESRQSAEETTSLPVDYTNETAEVVDEEQTTAPVAEMETDPALEALDVNAPSEPEATAPAKPEEPAASIWEVFGVPRPSETQELSQLEIDAAGEVEAASEIEEPEVEADDTPAREPAAAVALAAVVAAAVEAEDDVIAEAEIGVVAVEVPAPTSDTLELPPVPTRIGLRVVQRRKLVHLRRP